jgi:uncharacterized protein YkwD
MARAMAVALLFGLVGCFEKGSSDETDCGDEGGWTPGGDGQTDPTSGSTRHYLNGHSQDWLETDSTIIAEEMELLRLVNSWRIHRGRNPLSYDKALTRCARGHSRHHVEHGGFQGHINPEGDDFARRMELNGIDAPTSGENISYGAHTPLAAFEGWMNSNPHRENMERECYTRIGVGRHGSVFTANFAR